MPLQAVRGVPALVQDDDARSGRLAEGLSTVTANAAGLIALRALLRPFVNACLDPTPPGLFRDDVVALLARAPQKVIYERLVGDDDPDEGDMVPLGEFLRAIEIVRGAA